VKRAMKKNLHPDFDKAVKTTTKPYQAPMLRDLDEVSRTEGKPTTTIIEQSVNSGTAS